MNQTFGVIDPSMLAATKAMKARSIISLTGIANNTSIQTILKNA
jgi:hypothetical protein